MRKIPIRDYPSQEFTLQVGRNRVRFLWMYNTAADRWSISVWVNDEECPRIAGKRVVPNSNLFYGYEMFDVGQELWVEITPDDFSSNWYDRLVNNPQGAIIVLLTEAERLSIIDKFKSGSTQC